MNRLVLAALLFSFASVSTIALAAANEKAKRSSNAGAGAQTPAPSRPAKKGSLKAVKAQPAKIATRRKTCGNPNLTMCSEGVCPHGKQCLSDAETRACGCR